MKMQLANSIVLVYVAVSIHFTAARPSANGNSDGGNTDNDGQPYAAPLTADSSVSKIYFNILRFFH